MDRRMFVAGSIAAPVLGVSNGCLDSGGIATDPLEPTGPFDLSEVPNFCSHEHWGSIVSLGHAHGRTSPSTHPPVQSSGQPPSASSASSHTPSPHRPPHTQVSVSSRHLGWSRPGVGEQV